MDADDMDADDTDNADYQGCLARRLNTGIVAHPMFNPAIHCRDTAPKQNKGSTGLNPSSLICLSLFTI